MESVASERRPIVQILLKFLINYKPWGITACGCSCKVGGHSRPLVAELEAAEITVESWRTGCWVFPGNLMAKNKENKST